MDNEKFLMVIIVTMFVSILLVILNYLFFSRIEKQKNNELKQLKENQQRKLDTLRSEYKNNLKELAHTKSADSRIKVIESGRALASFTRELHNNNPAVTLFDEIALQNDLIAYGS